ncbi:MAG: hypothetical protein ABIU05_22425 [Nitrospirales bacterium]
MPSRVLWRHPSSIEKFGGNASPDTASEIVEEGKKMFRFIWQEAN